ncbi:efflux RND transporter periplasmic adaptor subunit [Parasutterella excrementihominis]|uniref:efflux RND transporter periplasmic adaptor subunit n=1 Tax=Parasutterella excrementihominis TaxID=487175 RepID=UPI003522C036
MAFLWPERIKSILVEEGDFVKAGQPVAEQETDTLKIEIEQAKAAEQAAYQTYLALKNGSRPEDIAKAEAAVLVAQSRLHLAQKDFERVDGIFKSTKGQGVSKQSLDTQSSQLQVAKNELFSAQKSLELAKIGPRAEDVARAYAQWQQTKAQVAQLELKLKQSTLYAPLDTTVRSRLLQPGDMASAQVPVLALAINSPKWVRAYVNEVNLGKIKPGQQAYVTIDAYPNEKIPGHVGFISSVAEFTPKTVQTPDLRTNLVYEVRILVEDKENHLRLGMPATVSFE